MEPGRPTEGDSTTTATTGDGWGADDAQLPHRFWIRSHRRLRPGRRGKRLAAMGLVLAVAALAGSTLPYLYASRPSRAQDVSVSPMHDPPNHQTSTDQSSEPAAPVTSASVPPSAPPIALPASKPRRSAASGTDPATSPPTTRPGPSPTAPPATAGPPAPTLVAPADGLTVWLVNRVSGQHVGVAADSISDGAPIVQSTSAGSAQQWRLDAVSGNCYQMTNVRSAKALDNPGGTRTDGTQMQQWTIGVGNVNQTWCLQSVGNGRYSIRNSASGSLLDLRDSVSGDGVAIQEWNTDPAAPNANQTWQLIRVG